MIEEKSDREGQAEFDVVEADDRGARLVLRGSLNQNAADSLGREIIALVEAKGWSDLTLDFKNVDVIDTQGIKVLFMIHGRMAKKGGLLHVAHPSDSVLRVLKLVQFDQLAEIDQAA